MFPIKALAQNREKLIKHYKDWPKHTFATISHLWCWATLSSSSHITVIGLGDAMDNLFNLDDY
jgi:hypothetical protein